MANDTDDRSATFNEMLSGFDKLMNFRMLQATKDEVILEYEIDDRHRQPYGIVHGGVHSAAVETACSTGAGIDAVSRGLAVVGVENHTSFVHAVRSGRVQVIAKPLTRGRRTQLWEATARSETGQVISTGRVRLLCLEMGSQLAGEAVRTRQRD